jgi:hypothetical protein
MVETLFRGAAHDNESKGEFVGLAALWIEQA